MFRQIMRTRFLIGKPDVERRAGHGFVVFPSGWHGQNNTRTFQIGKQRRTTSCIAGPKGISLATLFDADGLRFDLGPLKLISKGLEPGRLDVPQAFDELGSDFCSLGGDRDYYV